MATDLDRRSKADLIALIGKMVERYPDLEMLIELPVPGEKGSQPVDAEEHSPPGPSRALQWRRRMGRGACSGRANWPTSLTSGMGMRQSKDWSNAAIVYETIIRDSAGGIRQLPG